MTVTVHHTGWDESRERGSSVLRSSADTLILQNCNDAKLITLKCVKQKDTEEFADIKLRPITEQVLDGKSYVLQLASQQVDEKSAALTGKQREALDVLRRRFPGGATHAQWLTALPDAFNERTLYRAEDALVVAGLIRRNGKRRAMFLPISGT
jgi:hypothetical protein